ncbi:MAG TPA: glycerophosphodiester phosphodiesterase family protein [Thermomicrobiales bacterium]|nr:glycerophosphodiester phosphodiesterase family protein [Thermomicrobiales bacterium]
MLIIAHRGGATTTPENTIASFTNALALGADVIELDIHLSKDGVPVVIHDHTLERTTNGTGEVNSYTVAELQQFDAGQGEKIPTLAEVFALVGDKVPFVLELKALDAIPATVELIKQNPHIRWTGLSGVPGGLEALREAFPDVALCTGTMGSREGTLALVDRIEQSDYPITQEYLDRMRADAENFTIETAFDRAAEVNASMLIIYYEGASAENVAAAKARGLHTGAWTVNDVADARRMMEYGFDSLITDDPAAMIAMVAEARQT